MRRSLLAIASILLSFSVSAQSIVAAKAGLLQLVEGDVRINGAPAQQDGGSFLSLQEGDVLATSHGRAEVLLQPGSFLRVAEQASVKLISADLEDTQLQILSGAALIEVSELPKGTALIVRFLGSNAELKKRGLYEFTADAPGKVRVYDGEVSLKSEDVRAVRITKGKELALDRLFLGPVRFDPRMTSELYRWGARRARLLADANAAVANSLHSNQDVYSNANTYGSFGGSWIWNPRLLTYTYLPFRGRGYSAFPGVVFLSPAYVRTPAPLVAARSSFGGGVRTGLVSNSAPALPASTAPAVATPNSATHRR